MTLAEQRPPRTLGPGHDTFWEWCGKGELRLQRCDACGHMPWPVVQACEECGKESFSWVKLSGRGKLASWCTFAKDYYGGVLPVPWDTILVELEEGPYFLSNPKGFANSDASRGMALTVTFLECEDRNGPFKLPVFEPA